jgi:two-component system, NarL family, nitrate/nitrite response regulator NarL
MPRSGQTVGPILGPSLGSGQRPQGPRSVREDRVIVRKQPQAIAPSTVARITTLLICCNTVLHAGLKHILSDTPFALAEDVVEPTSDVAAVAGSGPVLILLCENLPPSEYLETLERLKLQCPAAWVVVLADHLDLNTIVRLFEAGLSGLCSPAMVGSSLVKALELVIAGERFLTSEVVSALLEQSRQSLPDAPAAPTTPVDGPAGRLSDREVRVLQCLMHGDSNKAIAHRLGLAEATIKVHIKSLLRKIHAANRTQAAMWAQQHLPMDIQPRG